MDDELLNNDLIDRFEEMLDENEQYYFDGEELNEIISYYLDVGDLPYANKAIEYALQLHPDSVDMRIKVLEYMLEVDMLHDANIMIDELKDIATNDLDFIIAQAKYWSMKNQHRQAIKFYKRALDFGMEEDYIQHCLGNEYLSLKEIGQALFHFKVALELDLDDELAFYACIQSFDEIHRTKDCIDFLNQYIDLRPYADFAWYQLGLQQMRLKNFHEAYQAFDYAVCINTKSISNFMKKAECLEKLNEHEKAIETYKEALDIDDSAAFTLMKIAKCYLAIQEKTKALHYYHKAIHEDPQLDKAWSDTSEIYESMGNIDEAIHYLERAIDLDSMQVNYWKRLAFLNITASRFEEAEQNYEKIVRIEPGHFFNWLGYTELLIILGEYKKAIDIANRGLQRFERAELYYQISCCEYLLNQNSKGSINLLRAKKLNSKLLDEMYAKYPILKLKQLESKSKLK